MPGNWRSSTKHALRAVAPGLAPLAGDATHARQPALGRGHDAAFALEVVALSAADADERRVRLDVGAIDDDIFALVGLDDDPLLLDEAADRMVRQVYLDVHRRFIDSVRQKPRRTIKIVILKKCHIKQKNLLPL